MVYMPQQPKCNKRHDREKESPRDMQHKQTFGFLLGRCRLGVEAYDRSDERLQVDTLPCPLQRGEGWHMDVERLCKIGELRIPNVWELSRPH